MSEERRGVVFGAAAYGIWGLFPLYWPLLEPAGAAEILAHRFVWSFVFILIVLIAARQLGRLRAVSTDRRRMVPLTAAACLISVNWYVYVYSVNSGHVVEASLGYFIVPLITVLLGVVVLRERLRPAQMAAVAVAAIAVVVLAVDYGRPPWIALALAASFGTYGLLKKKVAVSSTDGLAVESGVLLLPAVGYLAMLEVSGQSAFGHAGTANALLLAASGVVTAVPLLLFASSARRVPLVTLGLLQYLAPLLQFLIGVLIVDEQMPPVRWVGFGLVWVALMLFTSDQLRRQRRGPGAPHPLSL